MSSLNKKVYIENLSEVDHTIYEPYFKAYHGFTEGTNIWNSESIFSKHFGKKWKLKKRINNECGIA